MEDRPPNAAVELIILQIRAPALEDATARSARAVYDTIYLAFHRLLRESSGNRRLVQAAEAFSGQIRLLLSSSAAVPGRLEASLNEHRAIVEGVLSGDPSRAESAMRYHVRQAARALRAHLGKDATALA